MITRLGGIIGRLRQGATTIINRVRSGRRASSAGTGRSSGS